MLNSGDELKHILGYYSPILNRKIWCEGDFFNRDPIFRLIHIKLWILS